MDVDPQPTSDPPVPDGEAFRRLVSAVRDYAIFMLTPDGRVASWNSGAELIKQYRAEEAIGRHFSMFYEPAAIASGWPEEELRRAIRYGRFEDEGWRVRKDGSRFWANVVISVLTDASGALLGYAKVTRDLTERRRQEEQLRDSEEQLRLIVDGVKDHAMFMLDASGLVVSWNRAAQELLGYAPAEAIGREVAILYPPEERKAGRPQAEMSGAAHAGSFQSQSWKIRADGSRFWGQTSISAIGDANGALKGYVHILRDLTEQRRIEQLEDEGRRVTEFIAMLSHELRNPLAPIKNAVSILKLPQGKQQAGKYAEMIGRQVTHLTRLVDDLMDVSRITTGKIQIEPASIEVNTLVQLAVDSMRSTLEAAGHALRMELAPQPVFVHGDAVRLTQVIVNILNNAAKYTAPEGEICVGVLRNHTVVRLEVSDNGVGMSESLIQRAFDPFVQGDRSPGRTEGGLGIGLTLVKKIVDLHEGSVVAASAGPGMGTKITVTLPVIVEASTGISAVTSVPAAQSRTILVVDDNRDAADTLGELLRESGWDVVVAYTGLEALAVAAERELAVVLLDIGLPDMTGYEVARQLRHLPTGKHARIIATTGYGLAADRAASTDAGFNAHLVKPVDFDDVLRLIA